MTFELRSLTVHFLEEDKDLWEVIQSFPKDQQAIVIKKVLARHLKENKECQVKDAKSAELSNPVKLPTQPIWNLEALFVNSEMETKANQQVMDCGEENKLLQPSLTSNLLHHLFEIIGEEEDEDVIQFLRAPDILPSIIQSQEVSSKENNSIQAENKEDCNKDAIDSYDKNRVEPIQVEDNPVKSNGLNFILQHVIGEEEDEEVLQFFGNSRDDDSTDHNEPAHE